MRSLPIFTLFACVLLCANAQSLGGSYFKDFKDDLLIQAEDYLEQNTNNYEITTEDDEVFIYLFMKMLQQSFLFPNQMF